MKNTTGYLIGALSGIVVVSALGYAIEKPGQASNAFSHMQSSSLLARIIDMPIRTNGTEVLLDTAHDLSQRNRPTLDRFNLNRIPSPYQDNKRHTALYKDANNFGEYLNEERQEKTAISKYLPYKTKEELILATLGLGLGITTALSYANRKSERKTKV